MATGGGKEANEQRILRLTDIAEEPLEFLSPIRGYDKMPLVSLEEAVEPLVTILRDVQSDAYVAKQRCKKPVDELTQDESASIMLYTMSCHPLEECLYFVLNQTLGSPGPDRQQKLKPWYLYLRLLLNALFRLPPARETGYRGVREDLSERYIEGETIVWWGLSSCYPAIGALKSDEFLGKTGARTMFTIQYESARNICKHSFYPTENEVLLLPATQFQVISCLDQGDLHIIQLKETRPLYPLLQPAPVIVPESSQTSIEETSKYVADNLKATALHNFDEDMNKLRKEVGGNAGVAFVDLNDINGYKRVVWATNGPKWRIAVHGINLEGFCNNNTCEAYGKRVIIGIGMKIFDLLCDADPSTTKCPMCKQYVEPITCGFNNCYWRWEGIKQLPKQPPMRCSDDWKAADDAYHYFDQTLEGTATTSGTAIWRKLIIEAKPLKN